MTDILDQIEERESASAGLALQGAITTPADRAAMARQYAKELGLPAEAVSHDLEESEREVKVRRATAALASAPKTRAWVADPENAAIAHDAVEGLSGIERLWGTMVRATPFGWREGDGAAIKKGLHGIFNTTAFEKLYHGLSMAGVDEMQRRGQTVPFKTPRLTAGDYEAGREDARQGFRRASERQQALTPQIENPVGRGVYSGLQSLVQTAPAIGAGILSRNPLPTLAIMGTQAGGEQYGEVRSRGGTAGEATLGAYGVGGVEAATELLPMGFLVQKFGKAGLTEFVSGLLGRELLTEQVATHLQDAIDTGIANPDKTWEDYWAERGDATLQTAIATTTQATVIGGLGGLARQRQKEDVTRRAQTLDEIIAAVQANPVTERAPDRMAALVSELAGDERVYVPAERVLEYFQDKPPEEIERTLYDWGIAEQWGDIAAGAEVVFDKGVYVTRVAGTDAHAAWRDDVRDGLGAMSPREAAESDDIDELIAQAAKEAFDAARDAQAASEPQQRVFEDVLSKLREAGYTLDAARPQATLWTEYFATRAARNPDRYPDAWSAYQAKPVTVRVEVPEALRQSYERADQLLNALRRRVASRKQGELRGESLLEFVSKGGGIVDAGGELSAMDMEGWHKERPFRRKLVRAAADDGSDIDFMIERVAERAKDAGYIEEDTAEALLAAMREERAGRTRYSSAVGVDQNAVEFDSALDDLEEMLSRLGIDLDTIQNDEVKGLLEKWAAEPTGEQFEQSATRQFAHDLDAMIRGTAAERAMLRLGRTPGPFRALGARDLPLVMSQAVARKIMGGKHHLDRVTVEKLPALLADPVLVFTSATEENSLVAVLKEYDRDGNPLIAALHLSEGRIQVNSVKSVYGKDRHEWFGEQIKAGRLRYIDAEGAPRWFGGIAPKGPETREGRGAGLQLPGWEPTRGAGKKVVTKADLVKAGRFEQGGGDGPRGSITFDRAGAVISLFEGRDLSTFLHESGHLWVENLIDDATDPDAPSQVREDMATVLRWMGAKAPKGATAADIRAAITADMHERWARASEAYLMEGKAPSEALRDAFARFKAWLVSIYKAVSGLNTPINDDIRGVLDRLVATDEEIALARRSQAMEALFQTPEEMGATPQVFAAYREAVDRSKVDAHDRLLARVMSAIRRRREAEWREEAEALRPAIEARVDAEPDMAALNFLRASPVKLSSASVADVMGSPSFLADLPRAVPPIYNDKDGLHPDDAAQAAGFRTGEEMLRALAALEAERRAMVAAKDKRSVRRARIEAETRREMLERHGDVLSDGSIEEEAVSALHGEKQGEVLAEELRALASRARVTPTPLKAMRAFADRTIAAKRERDLQPGVYLRAERKAANATIQAVAAGDHAEAFRQKQQQLLNFQLYVAARAAREDVDKAVRAFTRYSNAKALKGMAQDYLEQIHALLERFSFRRTTLREIDERKSFEAWAAAKLAEGEAVVVPERFQRDRFAKPWRELTVEEMRGLYDAVRNVAHLGRMKQDLLDGKARRDFEEVVQEALDQAMTLPSRKPNLRVGKPKGMAAVGEGILQADASLLKIETLADMLDGNKPDGVFNRLLVRRAAAAENERGTLREAFMRPVVEAYNAIPGAVKRRWNSKVASPLTDPLTGEPFDLRRGDLLGLAVHVGNASNMEKLSKGYEWDPAAIMGLLRRELSKEEWDFVQANWTAMESLRPHIARVERALSGVEPEWIDPVPVETPHGTYAGGYFPVTYDPIRDANADKHDKQDADFFGGVYFSAATPKGHTVTRTDYHGPVLIDLNASVLSHVNKVVTRIAYAEFVRDARKFMGDKRIRTLVQTKLGDPYYEQFMPWLQRQVNDQILSDRALSFMNRFARRARINWQIAVMGLSVTTGAAQIAGLASSSGVVGPTWVSHGVTKAAVLAKQGKLWEYVFERSEEMRQRNVDLDRDLRDALRDLAGKPDPLNRIRAAAMAHIGFIDRYLVAAPTWIGAFDKALTEGVDEVEAIARADKAVRQSQGSGRPYDLSAVQGPNSEWLKLFTLAYSYFNVQYNRQREAGRAVRTGDFRRAFTLSFWFMVASPVAGALLTGDWPDEDEDGALAGWAKWFARKTFFGAFSGVPIVRDVAAVADRKLGGDFASFGGTPISRAGDMAFKLTKDIADAIDPDEEASDRWLKHAIETPGYFLGLPTLQIGRSSQYLWDLMDGEQEPENVVELMYGAVKGPQKNQEG